MIFDRSLPIKILISVIAILMTLSVFPAAVLAAGAAESDDTAVSGVETSEVSDSAESCRRAPDPGVYRIKNVACGLYLDSRGGASPLGLRAFREGADSQCFILDKPEGSVCSFGIIPCDLSDAGSYTHVLETPDTMAGSLLAAVPGASAGPGGCSAFDIIMLKDGSYTIAPSSGDNLLAVLTADPADASVFISDYDHGDSCSSWILEPVPVTGITTAFSFTRVKLGSEGRFYARILPYSPDSSSAYWTSDNPSVLMIDPDGDYFAAGTGQATVTASAGGVAKSFTVEVTDRSAFTFYSQNNMTGSDWDASLLDRLYFSGSGYRKIFAIDDKLPGGSAAWIDKGCSITSFAMILHNMDARLVTGYDFRSGQRNYLPADPYTVALANTGNTGALSADSVLTGNPVYVSWNRIAGAFEADGKQIAVRRVYNGSRQVIKELLDAHPQGIIARFSRGDNSHYVVISRCLNPDAPKSSMYEFEFFDPAGYWRENGDGVPLNSTTSALYLHYSYASIAHLIVVDTVDRIKD